MSARSLATRDLKRSEREQNEARARLRIARADAAAVLADIGRLTYDSNDAAIAIKAARETLAAIKQESIDRAQLILDGNHPWIDFDDVQHACGLDTSFIWTAATLAPYVETYMKSELGN